MIVRRTEAERAAAYLRRLNDPPERPRRRRRARIFPEPGAITEIFREAKRCHR